MRSLAALLLIGCACDAAPEAAAPSARQAEPLQSALSRTAEPASPTSSEMRRATLTIVGMVCQSCAEAAKHTLERIEGVISAEADLQSGTATVVFDPAKTSVDTLAAAIEAVEREPAPAFEVTWRASD